MTLVSVVVPAYNHSRYVTECLASVLAQTHRELEVVVCDDASTDGTVEAIRSCADQRVHLTVNERNLGAAATMNRGILRARGELIAIISSDDAWVPDKLARQLAVLEREPAIGAVFSDVQVIDGHGRELQGEEAGHNGVVFRQADRGRHQWLHDLFWRHNALCHPSILIRAECYRRVGGYSEGLAQLPDFDQWVRLCMAYEIKVLPERLVRFRVFADDSNASAGTPVKLMRFETELVEVLRRYAALDFGEFTRVFPAYPRRGEADAALPTALHLACLCLADPEPARVPHIYRQLGWLLLRDLVAHDPSAMASMRERLPRVQALCGPGPSDPDYVLARLGLQCGGLAGAWGIQRLMQMMSDPANAERLARDHGFQPSDLIRLSGETPLIARSLVAEAQASADELSRTKRELAALLAARPGEAVMWAEARRLARELQDTQEQLRGVEHGLSFRLGRALTWPMRRLRGRAGRG